MAGVMKRLFGAYASPRVWLESTHLLLGLPVGIGLFTIVVTLLAVSVGTLITLVGLPLLVLTVAGGRLVGQVERARVKTLLGIELLAHAPISWRRGLWPRARQILADRPSWKGLGYALLMLPWGIATFAATVVLWTVAVSLVSLPLWGWLGDAPAAFTIGGTRFPLHGWSLVATAAAASLLGLLLMVVLPRVVHAIASLDAALARQLLSPNDAERLAARVAELQVSRDASVESSTTELRRIERDLHDGAQQRLVSLAMNLGRAKEQLQGSDDSRARELVGAAHDEAKYAIAELRDLVRGIHPAVLTDRGLDAAVSALVGRCSVPVGLHTELPRRLPAAIEAAAYFVIAEALTNVAKHSRAHSANVRVTERDGVLFVEVLDDGVGGADELHGGGLRGLRERVTAVEGRLRVASPAGGPTVVSVELPCAL